MEEDKKIGKLKAVYTGAVQAGEVEIAEIIKDGINIIENLINRNKELEEENIKLHTEIAEVVYWESSSVEQIKQDYIPKSKIREKIEELEKDVKDFEEYWSKDPRRFKRQKSIDYYKLEALKELLQEGDK